MNKIYLDKLCDFTLTTYNNYEYINGNKNFNLEDFLNNIKQNQSLNENGIFFKHNFIELKTLTPFIEYDQLVLVNPLCFNIWGNIKWFNFLNAILTILNDNYLHESNLIKKTILETADKTFRKKITISDNIDDQIILKVCELTNVSLIMISKDIKIKLFNEKNNISKVIVMVNENKEYYGVFNWTKKYFETNNKFIQYLIDKSSEIVKYDKSNIEDKDKFINVINKKKKIDINEGIEKEIKNDKNDKNNKNLLKNKSKKNINSNIFDFGEDNDISDNECVYDNDANLKENISKDKYEELHADENYALYISEVIDNNQYKLNEKNKISVDKIKKKNDKDIFVLNKNNQDTKKTNGVNNNGYENDDENNKIKDNKLSNYQDNCINNKETSIFKKTEKIVKKDIDKIANDVKMSMVLEKIQSYALKLGISIFEGSTKAGKPKNKTKTELVAEIKEYAKNSK